MMMTVMVMVMVGVIMMRMVIMRIMRMVVIMLINADAGGGSGFVLLHTLINQNYQNSTTELYQCVGPANIKRLRGKDHGPRCRHYLAPRLPGLPHLPHAAMACHGGDATPCPGRGKSAHSTQRRC